MIRDRDFGVTNPVRDRNFDKRVSRYPPLLTIRHSFIAEWRLFSFLNTPSSSNLNCSDKTRAFDFYNQTVEENTVLCQRRIKKLKKGSAAKCIFFLDTTE